MRQAFSAVIDFRIVLAGGEIATVANLNKGFSGHVMGFHGPIVVSFRKKSGNVIRLSRI